MKRLLSTLFAVLVLSTLTHSAFAQAGGTPNDSLVFKPFGNFSMQFFGDYYYQLGADTIPKRGNQYYSGNPKFYQAFDIRRVYLGYDYNFTKTIAAQLLLSHENGSPTAGDVVIDANRGLYVKAANIRFKGWIPNATVTFGQQGTYAFALSESMWNYRAIEKTVMDARGLATSNDLGIALAGTFDAAGTLGYSAMISNGNAAKAENDKYKKFAGEVNAKLLDRKLVVDVYYDMQSISKTVDRSTIAAFAGVTFDPVTVGVNYAMQSQDTSSAGKLTPNALSLFARATLIEKQLMVFARYDIWNPNSQVDKVYKENFITAGLDWQPEASGNAHVMPNVWINSYAEPSGANKINADVVGRLTFFYKF